MPFPRDHLRVGVDSSRWYSHLVSYRMNRLVGLGGGVLMSLAVGGGVWLIHAVAVWVLRNFVVLTDFFPV